MFLQMSVILFEGGHAWRGEGVWWGGAWQGACMTEGHAWQGACVAGETSTAEDGMHPSGMHSFCFML